MFLSITFYLGKYIFLICFLNNGLEYTHSSKCVNNVSFIFSLSCLPWNTPNKVVCASFESISTFFKRSICKATCRYLLHKHKWLCLWKNAGAVSPDKYCIPDSHLLFHTVKEENRTAFLSHNQLWTSLAWTHTNSSMFICCAL